MKSFIFPLIYLLLSNATTVYITKKSFLKALPLSLLLIPFPLYFSGLIFSSFKIGIVLNIIYALLSLPLIIKDYKNKNIQIFKNNYFTYGLLSFIFIYIFFFIYDYNRTFYAWDEVSHWGLMLKEMFRLDNFYSIKESTLLVHKDYPPMIQLYELFWMKCSMTFKECYASRALHIFCVSILLPFINIDNPLKKLNFKTSINYLLSYLKPILLTFIVLLIILLFDAHGIINTIYIDYPLSFLMAYIILLIMFEQNKTSNFLLINISVLSTFLLLSKQIALSFYVMILFFYGINLIKEKNINKFKIFEIIILLIILPLLTMNTWTRYISHFEITKQFKISDIKVNEIPKIIKNNNTKHIIITKFNDAIFNQNISNFKYGKLTYFSSFIIYTIIIFIVLFTFKEIKKKNLLKYYLTITIGYIGYAIMMLILYLFCFKEEGYTLASFDRYMVTYILIEYISLMIILIKHKEEKNTLKYYLFILTILVVTINNTVFYKIAPSIKKNESYFLKEDTTYIINNTEKNSKIFILSQTIPHVGIQIYANYYINPRKTNFDYYNFPINCINCEKEYNIEKYLLNYDYFYIYDTIFNIYEKYPYLKNLKSKQLYKIKKINDKITFEMISN